MSSTCRRCTGSLPDFRRSPAALASELCFRCYTDALARPHTIVKHRNCPACLSFNTASPIIPCDLHRFIAKGDANG